MTELPSESESESDTTVRTSHAPHLMLFVALGLLMISGKVRTGFGVDSQDSLPEACNAIDPSSAPWWELSVLPGIGETLARRIVDYRNTASQDSQEDGAVVAFDRVGDLQEVRGIGPKKLLRAGPYLKFADPPLTTTPKTPRE